MNRNIHFSKFKKKLCAYATITALMTTALSSAILADNIEITESEPLNTYVGSDNASINNIATLSIDDLYELRGIMSLDYDENITIINAIDARLEALGVEPITHLELEELLNNSTTVQGGEVTPLVDIQTSSTVNWSTYREVYVYRGVSYQLQYVIGVPSGTSSELIITDNIGEVDLNNVTTDNLNAVEIETKSYYSDPHGITGDISSDVTLRELLTDAMPTVPAYIFNISLDYDLSLSTTFKYVFVKYNGSLDAGNQVLSYEGTSTVYRSDIELGSSALSFTNRYHTIDGVINSAYYSDCKVKATEGFRQYKEEGNNDFPARYRLFYIINTSLVESMKYNINTPLTGF